MNVRYKDYLIETPETSPGRWRARVRRVDGRRIKILIPEKEVEVDHHERHGEFFSR